MKSLFSFRSEYAEYCMECIDAGEVPVSFKHWFETAYHYDMIDEMPTGSICMGFRSYVQSISIN